MIIRVGDTVGIVDKADGLCLGVVDALRLGRVAISSTMVCPELFDAVRVRVCGAWVSLGEVHLLHEEYLRIVGAH